MVAIASQTITYSPAYTLVPTYECFNRCTYCNFRRDPGKSQWLSLDQARSVLSRLQSQGIIEILILSGEVHPKSLRRQTWLQRIYDLCALALKMGFLPHTNVGPLSFEEMLHLKQVNVSMGLMLEQLTPKLLQSVHRHAPSKHPQVRLQQLTWAGKLQIPFTTGLLLGIGETEADWQQTLEAIARSHQQWGHIQEVILQPHQTGQTQLEARTPLDVKRFQAAIAMARQLLPAEITLQIPPNLIDAKALLACLELGVRDLGGIGPKDEVNPDYPHLQHPQLSALLASQSWQLQPRLPLYPKYDRWLSATLRPAVDQWRQQLSEATR
ncbi:MAG: 7,8-didemethyl-8-hydroxy-5-deazariboflavin synthase subunit CofG [Leptolyngbyaceae cyanobacterium SM1_1_3]|nr:7,8-didemethyl-8-hydroxy-5-deazariboflavin synthase subunit CofG [Leptolyngbyaceae cyanobacterium SM1_1_3]NJN02784.1 7,8-didemethyl-8-hydroxy-5-deazariboflavin synthase subunit CofG [Leptolyngbyaceae cyanobacterium RM1_1_2]